MAQCNSYKVRLSQAFVELKHFTIISRLLTDAYKDPTRSTVHTPTVVLNSKATCKSW